MPHRIFILLLVWLTFSAAQAQKKLQLPMTYGNSMVLQRNQPIRLTGHAAPDDRVQATLTDGHGHTLQGEAKADAHGLWHVTLAAQPAGGPYTLTFSTRGEKRTFTDVWLGEVWVCSGQSNMELTLGSIATAKRDLEAADTLTRLHLMNMPSPWPVYQQVWSPAFADSLDRHLVHQTGHWARCNAQTARPFSAIGFHFGRVLADSLNCHIGLINNAVGGATTEGWIDSLTLQRTLPEMLRGDWRKNPYIMEWARQRADYNLQAADSSRQHRHPYAPTFLFDEALRPIAQHDVRGVLWYQGESNADLPDVHRRLFPALEKSWRKAFRSPFLPFLTVQLSSISTRPIWPEFRNSQRELADSLSHTWMVVSSDLGDSLDVHPRRKAPIGERLAATALHQVYGRQEVVPCGPTPVMAVAMPHRTIGIRFQWADGLHAQDGHTLRTFEVAGSDGRFHPATRITVNGSMLLIGVPKEVDRPTEVRYGWQAYSHGNLVNRQGYPCSTFKMKVRTVTHPH